MRTFPALTTIHQDAALRARTAIRRLEALRDGTPCDAGILIAQFLGAEEHTEAFSYLPMAVSTVLSAWLRCKEHAAVPFWASFGAVAANTGLNYLLIFGKLGAPAMGVTGAAIATLVSQLLNLLLILIGFAVCLQSLRYGRCRCCSGFALAAGCFAIISVSRPRSPCCS